MRKLMIAIIAVFLCAPMVAFADDTGSACVGSHGCHGHEYDRDNPFEAGVGADVKIKQITEQAALEVQVRKDFVEGDRGSAYLVLKIDLTKPQK